MIILIFIFQKTPEIERKCSEETDEDVTEGELSMTLPRFQYMGRRVVASWVITCVVGIIRQEQSSSNFNPTLHWGLGWWHSLLLLWYGEREFLSGFLEISIWVSRRGFSSSQILPWKAEEHGRWYWDGAGTVRTFREWKWEETLVSATQDDISRDSLAVPASLSAALQLRHWQSELAFDDVRRICVPGA